LIFLSLRALTVVDCDAPLLDPAHVAAELVLLVAVLAELGLHREAPHNVEIAAVQLHLVQDLGAHLNHLVGLQLKGGRSNQC
jgi:hypothetical protein